MEWVWRLYSTGGPFSIRGRGRTSGRRGWNMLKAVNKLGPVARGLSAAGTSSLPLLIIGGLLYAAFFVKAEPEIGTQTSVETARAPGRVWRPAK